MDDLKLAHAIFDYFSECYTKKDFIQLREKMYTIIEQLIEEDILPTILRIEQRKDELI